MTRGKKPSPVPSAGEGTVPADGEVPQDKKPGPVPVAIVGIGASAGGLEAISRLLEALPDNTGMAFVIVTHLSPTRESMLAEILSRTTKLRVLEVHDEPVVHANIIYVIPPARTMVIDHGALRLFPRAKTEGRHHPVDVFLHSLAEDQRHRSIGVILSGMANDGTLGLEEVKAQGGITFAQNASAQHGGMPQSAIASGCVDFVLSPAGIAAELTHMAHHSQFNAPDRTASRAAEQPGIVRILQMLQAAVGADFSGYRRNMLYRRITRRMVLRKMESIREYARLLQKDQVELESLYYDIMINVTSFFRDPAAFEALKAEVFPRQIANRDRDDPIRVWTIGCSTGEEAYSIAIVLTEFLEEHGRAIPVQIFATDLNEAAIEKARAGVYAHGIFHDVSPERLRRYFSETSDGYRVNKIIREMCIFAPHNVLSDPPFSRIDLISCRNLLIYFEPAVQQKLIPALHYALNPDGCLWLGSSEAIGSYRDLFQIENANQRIYCKKPPPVRTAPKIPVRTPVTKGQPAGAKPDRSRDLAAFPFDVHREAERVLLGRYTPPGVLVNADLEILQFRGDTGPYLAPTPGRASLNVLKMLRDGLLVPVRGALVRAKKQLAPVREEGIRFISSGGARAICIEVIPVRGSTPAEDCFLVLFESGSATSAVRGTTSRARKKTAATRADDRLETSLLAQELAATKDYLQSVIEQQEVTNEELQSANEEIQSSNEELQSINEELETSKEEIQSSNEELASVNEELHNRNMELAQNNNDLLNLLGSVQMPILMLGADLRIRRFTPAAELLLNLIASDVGRPINHIKLNVDLPDLEAIVLDVIATATPQQRMVRDAEGCWFSVRVRPYRTADNNVEGAVVVLVDVDSLKQAEESLRESEARFRLLVDSAPVLLWVDDANGERFANRAYLDFVGVVQREVQGKQWHEFIYPDDRERYLATYRDAASRNAPFETQVRLRRANGQYRWMKSIATPRGGSDEFGGFVGSETDVADLKEAELALLHADRGRNEFLAMLAHELRNPLAPLRNVVQLLQVKGADKATVDWAWGALDRQVRNLTLLVDDLLDVSRITHGKINLRREPTDLLAALRNAGSLLEATITARHQSLVTDLPAHGIQVDADQLRLEQIFGNLLSNASKFTPEHGHIWLTAKELPDAPTVEVNIRDDGIGIGAEALPDVFDLFSQGERSLNRAHGGLGIGLTVVRRLVHLHGGEVTARSSGPGRGSEFVVRLPTVTPAAAGVASPAAPGASARHAPAGPVLLVDDNVDVRDGLAQLLRMRGYQVELAHDGPTALEAVRKSVPRTVLLDIGLPGQDGYELARELRAEPSLQGAVVIAVTGYGGPDERYRAREAGFDHYLIKPVDLAVLVELLERK